MISFGLYSSGLRPTLSFIYINNIANINNEIIPIIIEAYAVEVNVSKYAPTKDTIPDTRPSIKVLADTICKRNLLDAKLLNYCLINV